MKADPERRLRSRARGVERACLALAGLLPLLYVVVWVVLGPQEILQGLPQVSEVALTTGKGAAIFLVAGMPVLCVALALRHLGLCFGRFAEGELFGERAALGLMRAGVWTLAGAVLTILAPTVSGLILTYDAEPGHRMLTISVGSGSLIGLVLAAVFYLLGDVQRRAAALARDHAQIV